MLSDGSLAETDTRASFAALGSAIDRHHSMCLQHSIIAAFTVGKQTVFGHPCIPPHQARLSRCAVCIQRILRERRDDMQHASAGRLQHDSGRAADKCGLGQSARFSDQRSCSRNAALDQRIGSATHSTVTTVPNYTAARDAVRYARWRRQRD
jgi:hypothetical protein